MLKDMLAPAELDRLLERGESQLAGVAAALQAAWRRGDATETRREAHKLAGLAGTIGCTTLLALAREIEAGGPSKRNQTLLDRLQRVLPASVDALRRWRTGLAVS